jgi:hypothetical protein
MQTFPPRKVLALVSCSGVQLGAGVLEVIRIPLSVFVPQSSLSRTEISSLSLTAHYRVVNGAHAHPNMQPHTNLHTLPTLLYIRDRHYITHTLNASPQ